MILTVVLIVAIVDMTTPATLRHGHITFFTHDFQAFLLIEHLDFEIWTFHLRMGLLLNTGVASVAGVVSVGRLDDG